MGGGRMKPDGLKNQTVFTHHREDSLLKKFYFLRNWTFLLVVILSFWMLSGWVWAQAAVSTQHGGRLELIHADVSRGQEVNGQVLRILLGHVHIRQDSLELFCQRAVYHEQSRQVVLTGDVQLIRGSDSLFARRVTYFEESRIAIAEEDVRVRRPHQQMDCQYLEYHYQNDQILARRHLLLRDLSNQVFISGEQGEYLPEKEFAYIQRHSHLWKVDSTGHDTLHIYARKLIYRFGEEKEALARDSVYIRQGELTATCDSAFYLVKEHRVKLLGNPHALYRNNEMFGKTMALVLDSLEVREVQIRGNALAVSVADSLRKKENRLSGKQLVMYIEQRQLREICAFTEARSQYYLEEEGEARGVNVATADTIRVYFTNQALDSIAVIGGAEGTYYPENYQGDIR